MDAIEKIVNLFEDAMTRELPHERMGRALEAMDIAQETKSESLIKLTQILFRLVNTHVEPR